MEGVAENSEREIRRNHDLMDISRILADYLKKGGYLPKIDK
jgi:hypothetical protein